MVVGDKGQNACNNSSPCSSHKLVRSHLSEPLFFSRWWLLGCSGV
jgi:hypothetical protein